MVRKSNYEERKKIISIIEALHQGSRINIDFYCKDCLHFTKTLLAHKFIKNHSCYLAEMLNDVRNILKQRDGQKLILLPFHI